MLAGSGKRSTDGSTPPAQTYSDILATGNSKVHMGNVNNIHTTNVYTDSSDHGTASQDKVSKKCINALFLTDPEIDRETLISTKGDRAVGTCEWTNRDPTYQAWLRGDPPLLWIKGGPGTGKTMLSIYLTQELERTLEDDSQLLYYFCRNDDEKRNNAAAVLRSLLWQILKRNRDLARHMLQYFETPEQTQSSLSSQETLWIILVKILHDPTPVTRLCVLDGLDECDKASQAWLVKKLMALMLPSRDTSRPSMFHLAVISRDLPGLERASQLKLNREHNANLRNDIEVFIAERVSDLSSRIYFDDDFRQHVVGELSRQAQGTFLWVGFAMTELLQKTTCTEIEEVLEGLPEGLPAIYGRMLLQIASRRGDVCVNILRWVTLAVRPLTVGILSVAVPVHPKGRLTGEQVTRDHMSFCDPLLVVAEDIVSLVHQSAKDFLLREDANGNETVEKFRIYPPEEAHFQLAWTCLNYIQQKFAWACSDYMQQEDQANRLVDLWGELIECVLKNPFLEYAINAWPEHANSSSQYSSELLKHPSGFFKENSSLQRAWSLTFAWDRSGSPSGHSATALHMACYVGNVAWAAESIPESFTQHEKRESVDSRHTPLIYAAGQGHEAVIRLLLDHGADVNAKGDRGATALGVAARAGHEAVVLQLLDCGADIHAENDDQQTPLHEAAGAGHKSIARLLIDGGVNADSRDRYSRTALHIASQRGYTDIVQQLLDCGADLEAVSGNRFTPLQDAAGEGHEDITQLLLGHGADVAFKNERGETALHQAVRYGHKGTVRLLLDSGADIEAMDLDRRTPLHEAATQGYEDIARQLLDYGPDTEAKRENIKGALFEAALNRRASMIQLLIDRGVDPSAEDRFGRAALDRVVESGREACAKAETERAEEEERWKDFKPFPFSPAPKI